MGCYGSTSERLLTQPEEVKAGLIEIGPAGVGSEWISRS